MEKNHRVYAERRVRLYEAVGDAMTRWANLESALLRAFSQALKLPTKTAAALLVHVKTFALALDLTNAAMQSRLNGRAELAHWNSLVEFIRELSGDRNYMAHTSVVAHGKGHPATADWALATPKIGPSMTSFLAGIDKIDAMDAHEAQEIVADIQHAVDLLSEFLKALESGDTSPEKFGRPIERRRPPRKQRREAARKARPSPPQSSQA